MITFRFRVVRFKSAVILLAVLWFIPIISSGIAAEHGESTAVLVRKLDDLNRRLAVMEGLLERQIHQGELLQTKLNALAVAVHDEQVKRSLQSPPPKPVASPVAKPVAKPPEKSPVKPTVKPEVKPVAMPSAMPAAMPQKILPDGNPESQYRFATNLLVGNRYEEAAKAFAEFIKDNVKHKLAANARYWLAETHYVRGDYQRASVLFSQAYKLDEAGPKADDNLLKLALSLKNLGKDADSCKVLSSLKQQMKGKSNLFKRRVATESKSCPS